MFQGSLVALVTPMLADGGLDFARLARLVEFHIEQGTDAIVSVGTTGESATLSEEEHIEVMAKTIAFAAGRIPVIAGTGANSTSEAIQLTRAAKDIGAAACLLVTPYYNKPTQEGLYLHHRKIAEEVDIPQILYNVPGRTGVDMLPATVARLADVPNIVGVKDATGDLQRGKELIALCKDKISVFSGDDATAMELILMGAKGDISVTANVAPRQMHEMCLAALQGDRGKAQEINQEIARLHEVLFCESNPIPVKWALMEMGLIGPGIRLPLTLLAQEFHPRVRTALQESTALA